MKEKVMKWKSTLGEMRTVTNKEFYMAGTILFLIGILVGFFFAPIKKGIYCGNNNGNAYCYEKEEMSKKDCKKKDCKEKDCKK